MTDARERVGASLEKIKGDKPLAAGGIVRGPGRMFVDGERPIGRAHSIALGYTPEQIKQMERAQLEGAKRIALDFQASFNVVGAAFRKMLPALRKLMPLLVEIEQEKKARVAAMRRHARRKGRKK